MATGDGDEGYHRSILELLMIQKSGEHQLRLVVYSIICQGFINPRWLAGILPSTVSPPYSWKKKRHLICQVTQWQLGHPSLGGKELEEMVKTTEIT